MPGTDNTPNNDSQVILLERGYAPTTMDGQLVAVPLSPDCGDATCVPALVDGQAVAVPVFDVSAHLNTMAARLADHRRAVDALDPVPAAAPAVDPGLSLAVRQYVLYGSIAALAAGGAVWMLGAAVAEVAPHASQLGDLLKWAAIFVAAVVLGVAGLLGKLRSVAAGTGTGTGASANATGEGASATGTVLALVHRTHTTTIGKQSAGWRGVVNNHNG
ncbi:hypothetical protein P3T27_006620 [Kitasatospora sp. MAA19]|uniref:hypothetical protein n=1 Tax=Kitasatospora sp. MAA19 TaxID=3035090 RepID=UPI0024736521|nr:hypothetical protein [Kitasatospora sp. MAA19]MDH6709871.1 hypothetical protein [Kitasatospora sp. MAA19]